MVAESAAHTPAARADRIPPHSEDSERGVLGSILLDATRVLDLAIERQLDIASFYVPRHALIYEAMLGMNGTGLPIDSLTVCERLKASGKLDAVGGPAFIDGLIDSTPTPAHAEYYIDIVRQKWILRSIIACSRDAERECYEVDDTADGILARAEQAFLDISERRHGSVVPWGEAIHRTMEHVERIFSTKRGVTGVSTGFANLDAKLLGLRPSEMIVIAARPSMGKTSLAMNIVENVALGRGDPDKQRRPVGVFSLEMSQDALVMRMLCGHARVSAFELMRGALGKHAHGALMTAASDLNKAEIFVDDTGGLDIMELRARARRLRRKQKVELIVIDYLQLCHSREYAKQGKQIETAHISGNLKAMAKELRIPVLVLSQLSRAPEQRDKLGTPKLSDLRDSGAIEQDADVVCLLRRPCLYPDDKEAGDETLALVDVAKQRNGPTGEVRLNFDRDYTQFRDRAVGVDGADGSRAPVEDDGL